MTQQPEKPEDRIEQIIDEFDDLRFSTYSVQQDFLRKHIKQLLAKEREKVMAITKRKVHLYVDRALTGFHIIDAIKEELDNMSNDPPNKRR